MQVIVHELTKRYVSVQGDVLAVDRVSFRTREGEFVCLVGPSGCGKTTLLKLLAGLITPSSGRVRYDGRRTAALLNAMVFQEDSVFPWMSVLDNVAFPLEMQGVPPARRLQVVREFVGRVGLAKFAGHYPGQLSTGMRQRVGIARAFAANPEVLLMDEPFAALDAQMKAVLQEELIALWSAQARTVVYVTHDIDEAIFMADRVLVLSGQPGRIVMELPVPFRRPRDPSVRGHREFVIVSVGAFFPAVINAAAGVTGVRPVFFEVARNFGASRWQKFWRVVVPGSLPMVFAGLRLAFGMALLMVVASEFVAARRGIGALIWLSWETLRTDKLYAGIASWSIIGICSSALLTASHRAVIRRK